MIQFNIQQKDDAYYYNIRQMKRTATICVVLSCQRTVTQYNIPYHRLSKYHRLTSKEKQFTRVKQDIKYYIATTKPTNVSCHRMSRIRFVKTYQHKRTKNASKIEEEREREKKIEWHWDEYWASIYCAFEFLFVLQFPLSTLSTNTRSIVSYYQR